MSGGLIGGIISGVGNLFNSVFGFAGTAVSSKNDTKIAAMRLDAMDRQTEQLRMVLETMERNGQFDINNMNSQDTPKKMFDSENIIKVVVFVGISLTVFIAVYFLTKRKKQ